MLTRSGPTRASSPNQSCGLRRPKSGSDRPRETRFPRKSGPRFGGSRLPRPSETRSLAKPASAASRSCRSLRSESGRTRVSSQASARTFTAAFLDDRQCRCDTARSLPSAGAAGGAAVPDRASTSVVEIVQRDNAATDEQRARNPWRSIGVRCVVGRCLLPVRAEVWPLLPQRRRRRSACLARRTSALARLVAAGLLARERTRARFPRLRGLRATRLEVTRERQTGSRSVAFAVRDVPLPDRREEPALSAERARNESAVGAVNSVLGLSRLGRPRPPFRCARARRGFDRWRRCGA
jgi:hypothetical protein